MPLRPEHESAVRQLAVWKHRQRDETIRGDGRLSPRDVYADMMKTTFAPALRTAGSPRVKRPVRATVRDSLGAAGISEVLLQRRR
jgi:hypothetical protein